MATRVYGASDDLIEFEGDVYGEVGCCCTDDHEHGALIVFSDGTIIAAKYGKGGMGIWGLTLVARGPLFVAIEPCTDEDAEVYSDVATFADGLTRAWAATEWELVG